MSLPRKVTERIDKLPSDLRAEVLAAELIEQGVAAEKVRLLPAGSSRRSYRHDILSVAQDEESVLTFYLSREGFYDGLPEMLFHEPVQNPAEQDTEAAVRRMKELRQEEMKVRQFFAPLENAFNHERVFLEQEERRTVMGYTNAANQRLFRKFWDIPEGFSGDQINLLLSILPVTHHVRANFPLLSRFMTAIMGQPIVVRPGMATLPPAGDIPSAGLGEASLGIDFITAGPAHWPGPGCTVRILNVPLKHVADFLEGGHSARLLSSLYRFFLPADYEAVLELSVREEDCRFNLSGPDCPEDPVLGYSTCLN